MSLKNVQSVALCLPLLLACQKAAEDPHATSTTEASASSKPAAPGSGPTAAKEDKTLPLSGLVKLDEGLSVDDIKPTDVLFIMARQSLGGRPGMLVAVVRYGNVEFPKRYEISQGNVMMTDIPFSGPFRIDARLDRDGDPMTKTADDLYASFDGDVLNGQEGVHLVLKKGAPPPPAQLQAPPSGHPGQRPASQPAK